MELWQNAKAIDRLHWDSISLVFHNHSYLLDFFFDPKEPRISHEPMEMLRLSRGFSSGEQILIRVALDIWSGSGNTKVWNLLESLDEESLSKVLKALAVFRGIKSAN